MLNPFPIQFLALLAYMLLRIFVGSIFLYFGVSHIQRRNEIVHALSFPLFGHNLFLVWYFALYELLIGAMFFFGFYTQIAALLAVILCIKMLIFYNRFTSTYIPSKIFYVLLLGASLSLFITGAGAFAFDLPI